MNFHLVGRIEYNIEFIINNNKTRIPVRSCNLSPEKKKEDQCSSVRFVIFHRTIQTKLEITVKKRLSVQYDDDDDDDDHSMYEQQQQLQLSKESRNRTRTTTTTTRHNTLTSIAAAAPVAAPPNNPAWRRRRRFSCIGVYDGRVSIGSVVGGRVCGWIAL